MYSLHWSETAGQIEFPQWDTHEAIQVELDARCRCLYMVKAGSRDRDFGATRNPVSAPEPNMTGEHNAPLIVI
jgi:hypothetical protein